MQTQTLTKDQFGAFLAVRAEEMKTVRPKEIRIQRGIGGQGAKRRFVINNTPVPPESFNKVAEYLKVPGGFLQTAPFQLASDVVAFMAKEASVLDRELVQRKSAFVGIKPRDQIFVPAQQVFEKLEKELPDFEKAVVTDTGDTVRAQIVSSDIEFKPKKDDIVRGGLSLLYSELHKPLPTVNAFTERLVCLNGMMHTEFDREFTFDDFDEFTTALPDTVKDIRKHINNVVKVSMKKSAELKVDSSQAIRRIFQKYRISSKYLDGALAALKVEGDDTVWGVLNAITRAAKNWQTDTSFLRLESVAGEALIEAGKAHCPSCYAEL